MKAVLGLLVFLAAGGAVFYYFGGYCTFDASQQGRDARAAIKPGMTWKQVIDAATTPNHYCKLIKETQRFGGEEIELIRPGPWMKFDADHMADRLEGDSLPNGFMFKYVYSNKVAFSVTFDEAGTVMSVNDMATMRDLLQLQDD